MQRKIIGYGLAVVSTILSVMFLILFLNVVLEIFKMVAGGFSAYQIGYISPLIVGLVVLGMGAYFLWKYSLKLIGA